MQNNLKELFKKDCIEGKVYYCEVHYTDPKLTFSRKIVKFQEEGYYLWAIDMDRGHVSRYTHKGTMPALTSKKEFTWYFREATIEEIEFGLLCAAAGKIIDELPTQEINNYEIY